MSLQIVVLILKNKIEDLQTVSLQDPEAAEDRVLSAVTLSMLVKEFGVKVNDNELNVKDAENLVRCLYLTPDVTKKPCSFYDVVLANFSDMIEYV